MRVILGDRQTGKTTDLIKLAAERGGYIVCHTENEAHRVFREAYDQGYEITHPITFADLLNGHFYAKGIRELYIDNADMLLSTICRGVHLEAVSLTREP